MLLRGGLARLAGTGLELTPRGEAALARPSYQALGELWGRWLWSVSHDESSRIEAIRGQRKPGALTAAARRRASEMAGGAGRRPARHLDRRGHPVRDPAGAARSARGGQEPAGPVGALPRRFVSRIARASERDEAWNALEGRSRCACSSSTRPPSA